jgi:DNA repair photolyase
VLSGAGLVGRHFFPSYSLNPYRGCQHNCWYCDGQYYMEHGLRLKYKFLIHDGPMEISPEILIKVNFPEVLVKDMTTLKTKGEITIGTTADAYQPAEAKYRLTRQILQIIKDNNYPFSISTKSDIIVQDLDLISEIAKKNWVYIEYSMTTLDEKLARLLEPGAPSPQKRLAAMKKTSEAGVLTGVWMMPWIPYITDSDENFESIIKAAVQNGAKFISGEALRLREENIERAHFMEFLEKYYPELIPKYRSLYGNNTIPAESYLLEKQEKIVGLCRKYNINYLPHFYNRRIAFRFYGSSYGRYSKHVQLLNYFVIRQFLRNMRIRFPSSEFVTNLLKILGFFPGP